MADGRTLNTQFSNAHDNTFSRPVLNTAGQNQTINIHYYGVAASHTESGRQSPDVSEAIEVGPQQSTSTQQATVDLGEVESLQPRTPQPGIGRVDGLLSSDELLRELKSRRFNVAVESVYYSPPMGGTGPTCSVLLETNLVLQKGDVFESAEFPFTAQPELVVTSTDNGPAITITVDISKHFPSDDQHFTPEERDTRNVRITSVVGNTSGRISLLQCPFKPKNGPKRITWSYRNENAIFYPCTVKLLVVVEKYGPSNPQSEYPFSFHLILKEELVVQLQSSILKDAIEFFGKLLTSQHRGWHFHIHGNYNPVPVMNALIEARKVEAGGIKYPTLYGLYPGVKSWITV
ncbi:hypothetical protein VKT23_000316 [Stygiomarasmius scandens]|uniref:Uncharacterized protein n=1 Tax=Marasmiellus scandens TaxID=2682957 RepID=A0ABR1K3Y5_9AGAR